MSIFEDTHRFIREIDQENESIERQISELLARPQRVKIKDEPTGVRPLPDEGAIAQLLEEKEQATEELRLTKALHQDQLQELGTALQEERSAMLKLQELNRDLLAQVKTLTQTELHSRQVVAQLQLQLQAKDAELSETNRQHQALVAAATAFETKAAALCQDNQALRHQLCSLLASKLK